MRAAVDGTTRRNSATAVVDRCRRPGCDRADQQHETDHAQRTPLDEGGEVVVVRLLHRRGRRRPERQPRAGRPASEDRLPVRNSSYSWAKSCSRAEALLELRATEYCTNLLSLW